MFYGLCSHVLLTTSVPALYLLGLKNRALRNTPLPTEISSNPVVQCEAHSVIALHMVAMLVEFNAHENQMCQQSQNSFLRQPEDAVSSLTFLGEEFLPPSDMAQLVLILFTIAVFTIPAVILGQDIGGAFAVACSFQVCHSLALVQLELSTGVFHTLPFLQEKCGHPNSVQGALCLLARASLLW